ncbi:hypothetical protein POM88_039634 [Heracleum sosnowskyi]|uniref:Uncharacterized protein n=1 Tax=Heracleum sosnowskyi TaxID=360622 RepID=A0AAD8HCK8_9APIA|nr:hypothetical protein POM88_039634 [Heracleum sosnowskyi]
MSTSLSFVSPSPFLHSSVAGKPNAVAISRRNLSTPASSNGWWTSLLGWSSDPDYIEGSGSGSGSGVEDPNVGESGAPVKQTGSRFRVGCFTEEKAKQMRIKTAESANSHEMYHSAIASRLASDVSDR